MHVVLVSGVFSPGSKMNTPFWGVVMAVACVVPGRFVAVKCIPD